MKLRCLLGSRQWIWGWLYFCFVKYKHQITDNLRKKSKNITIYLITVSKKYHRDILCFLEEEQFRVLCGGVCGNIILASEKTWTTEVHHHGMPERVKNLFQVTRSILASEKIWTGIVFHRGIYEIA